MTKFKKATLASKKCKGKKKRVFQACVKRVTKGGPVNPSKHKAKSHKSHCRGGIKARDARMGRATKACRGKGVFGPRIACLRRMLKCH